MQCYCNSKNLYRSDYSQKQAFFCVDGKQYSTRRQGFTTKNLQKQQSKCLSINPIYSSIQQTSQHWLPTSIQSISWDQIQFNPTWFYRQFISKNVPCVITDSMEGDQIFQRWADQTYLKEVLQNYQGVSVSLTPDGFADSVKGDFFVQPDEIKTSISKFLDHKQHYPGAIPYIQHQNSSLTEEMWILNAQIPQQNLKFISNHLFRGSAPDAQNFWMGFDQSVSSLHKDPYQNFYTTITGQKHFTLLPPIQILHLTQQCNKSAKWCFDKQNCTFVCKQQKFQTNWITCNPDLDLDVQNKQMFPYLERARKYHVVLKKEQMLYLPSTWHHQVAQCKHKDPYTIAINYWFDMDFTHNYSLYQVCRKLKGFQ